MDGCSRNVWLFWLETSAFPVEVICVTKWHWYLPFLGVAHLIHSRMTFIFSTGTSHTVSSGDQIVHSQVFFQSFLLGEKIMSPKVPDLTFWVIQIQPVFIIPVLKLIQFFLYTVLLHIHTTYCIIRKFHEHSTTFSAKVVKNVK